jgi:ubiquinone/menaquinone biosynthesis C-methylase UbiE
VLDIPCGTGWGTSLLRGYRFVWGVDIADDAVRYAREHYEQKGRLEFMSGSMEKVPLPDDAVDVVLCLEGFEHVSQASGAEFLRETRRVLRRGGSFVVTCPVLDEHGKATSNPHHLYEYPEAELIGLLNENFRILELTRFRSPDGPEYRAVCESFKGARYRSNG